MIKRISFIVLAILLIGGIAFAATPGYRKDPGVGEIKGQGKYPSDAHKTFRLVRYIGDSTLSSPALVIWHLTEDDGVTIGTTTTSADSAVAGIIVQDALSREVEGNTALQDVGKQNWTWLQTYGLSTVNVQGSVATAGSAMGTNGTTAGRASPFVASTSSATVNGNAGFFYDTATEDATAVQCFIRTE